jgi:putative ABC transport system permease protein
MKPYSINYFLKTIKNNGWYSVLSMLSLVLGLTCFIFIVIHVYGELTYDYQHENKDRIYRVGLNVHTKSGIDKYPYSSMPFGSVIKQDIPVVEDFVRFSEFGSIFIKDKETQSCTEVNDFYLVDSTIFNVFTHKFIQGNPRRSLSEPNTIVLTESFSKKMRIEFGDFVTIIGENNKDVPCKVTGIIEDLKENSFLKFNALVAMSTVPQFIGKEYFDYAKVQHKRPECYTFFLFKENFNKNDVHQYFDTYLEEYMNNEEDGMRFDVNCIKLTDLRLSIGLNEDLPKGNLTSIVILCVIGFLIFIVSCINYINIEIALSLKKYKEIAIKKIHGAKNKHIRTQYLINSTIFVSICLLITLFVVSKLAVYYSIFTGQEFSWDLLLSLKFGLFILVLWFTISFLSGSYTSFYLTKVNALKVLTQNNKTSRGKNSTARFLVLIQLIICVGTVFCTLVISNQYEFMTNKDLGFDPSNVITVSITENSIQEKINQIKDELKKEDCIVNVSASAHIMNANKFEIFLKEEGELKSYLEEGYRIDGEYMNVLNLKLLNGRNFSNVRKIDQTNSCIINETMAKKFGWDEDAIGKEIYRKYNQKTYPLTVIGIVKDFHFENLNNEIGPVFFMMTVSPRLLNVKYKKGEEKLAVNAIQSKISEFGSELPMEYSFLSEEIKNKYKEEHRFNTLFRIFTFLIIFISLIGIIGLTSHNARVQLKDIAIKKVIGATLSNIFYEYILRIIKLLVVAAFIILPLSYYFLNDWLDNYAYRIDISLSHILVSIITILLIVVLSIVLSLRSLIYLNPIKFLKNE